MATPKMQRRKPGEHPVSSGTDKPSPNLVPLGVNRTSMLPTIEITPPEAKLAAKNITAVRKPKEKPYREVGSLEGHLQRVERDGYGRPLLYVKLRVSGETVKCIARGSAQTEVEHHEIADIWKNKRVRVFGTIYYKALGQII